MSSSVRGVGGWISGLAALIAFGAAGCAGADAPNTLAYDPSADGAQSPISVTNGIAVGDTEPATTLPDELPAPTSEPQTSAAPTTAPPPPAMVEPTAPAAPPALTIGGASPAVETQPASTTIAPSTTIAATTDSPATTDSAPAPAAPAPAPAAGAGGGAGATPAATTPAPAQNPATGGATPAPAASSLTGYTVAGTCYAECVDSSTDADSSGATDGWGYENSASCIVAGSSPAQSAEGRCDAGGGGASSGSTPSSSTANSGTTGTPVAANGDGQCPTNLQCPSGIDCGCYLVSGLAANKKRLIDAGASIEMLASAMMETEMMDTNYVDGDGKTGDSYNAGTCKQNWYMMRTSHPAWQNLSANDYATSRAMNNDLALDVQVYNESRAYFGSSWMAGHRNGQSGIQNPNTADIQGFQRGHEWTIQQLQNHTTDDVRFWLQIQAIIVE